MLCENRLAIRPPLPARATSSVATALRSAHGRRRAAVVPRDSRGRAGRAAAALRVERARKLAGLVPGGDVRRDPRSSEAAHAVAKGVDLGGVDGAAAARLTAAAPPGIAAPRPGRPAAACERADGAGARRAQLVLHLHRLDDDQQRAGVDRVRPAATCTCVTRPLIGARSSPAARAERRGAALEAGVDDGELGAGGEPPAGVAVAAEGGADLAAVDLGLDLAAGVVAAALGEADDPVLRVAAAGDEVGAGAGQAPRSRLAADDERHAAGHRRRRRPAAPERRQVLARQQGRGRGGERFERRRRAARRAASSANAVGQEIGRRLARQRSRDGAAPSPGRRGWSAGRGSGGRAPRPAARWPRRASARGRSACRASSRRTG